MLFFSLFHHIDETYFSQAFTRKEIPQDIPDLKITAEKSILQEAAPFLVKDGIISSNSELRRLLAQGGVSLNDEKVSTPDTPVKNGDVLKLGKKRFVKLIL